MADRLISADALQKTFNEVSSGLLAKPELSKDAEHIVRACLMVTQMINDAPTIEAEPIKHGRWKVLASGNDAVCTNCNHYWIQNGDQYDYHYCPNCGARMDAQIGEDKSHPFAESVMMGMDEVEE